jgi:hypothetical protein
MSHCQNFLKESFNLYIFSVHNFLKYDFKLVYHSLIKKKHFCTENCPSNCIFLASGELFHFMCAFALSMAEKNHIFCDRYCSRPARENVMNAHGETRLFLIVVNQPKIQ